MTGTVTWEVLLWIVGIVFSAGVAVAGFLLWVWNIVKGLRADWDTELADRDLKIEAVNERAKLIENDLRREVNEYKQHAGETFATKTGVTGAVERVESAVGRLTAQVEGAVDRLTGRIDRLLVERRKED